jgi:hypothetical protein
MLALGNGLALKISGGPASSTLSGMKISAEAIEIAGAVQW